MIHASARGIRGAIGLVVAAAMLLGPAVTAARAAEEPADPVGKAIKNGVAYLYRAQKGDNWEAAPKRENETPHDVKGLQFGGLTAIATYALLAAGESQQDARIQKAVEWIGKTEYTGVYAMGMKLSVWNHLERLTPEQKQMLKRDTMLMMNAVKTNGDRLGLFHYSLDPTKLDFDHSCSNYGVLGMWQAAQQNLEIPTKFWEVVDAAWRRTQHKNGSWSYRKEGDKDHGGKETLSMTGAGVATLFITQDYIHAARGAECKGNIEDPNINAGIKWIAANYRQMAGEGHKLYALYNAERIGTASGLKYFGTVDWYKDGADILVKSQGADGSWGGVPNTCWALFFLVKGRAPIMFNKLEYSIDLKGDKGGVNWNQRPRDLANLTRHTGKALEKEFNWQIVNLKVNVHDLHDSPVLYISGDKALTFSKEDKAKLKEFVEGGGMILGHADCNAMAFNTSFIKLGQELFSNEFRDLPADHIIYSAHYSRKNWGAFNPGLKGITNGARELMVLIPHGDPARFWHIQNFSGGASKALTEMATNIYLYSIDKSTLTSRFKGQTHHIARLNSVKPTQTLKVARLEYTSPTWDPEPGGWPRFSNYLYNTRGVDTTVEKVKLGDGKLNSGGYKLAHLTGTVKFKLSDAQRQELKKFVEGGGTLFMDAAGGAVDFKDAAEGELVAMWGADAQRAIGAPLPLSHKLFATGNKIERVSYRDYAKRMLVSNLTVPRVRGIEVNNRTAVFYSAEDISVGLVGMTIDGIYGYTPDHSLKLAENVVLYALGGNPPPAQAVQAQPAPVKPADPPKNNGGGKVVPPKNNVVAPKPPAAKK